ncbi:peptide deformylase [Kribbella hippodromi]|uniref:Peptide deformylase n=1 Tax=Kribbella hippodromi TaxID=434347 RepID=A0ABN2E4H1_9ACTN
MATFIQGRSVRRLPELTDEVLRGSPRRITEYGEAILHRPCRTVREFGADRWAALIDDMFATMWIAEGCGLAANQVDVDARLFVYDLTDENGDRHLGHVFNPRIESLAGIVGDQSGGEGCLSVPGATEQVARPGRVVLRGVDLEARPLQVEASGYLARCLVHETQHLDGTVYVDGLPPSARERALLQSASARNTVFARREARQRELGK